MLKRVYVCVLDFGFNQSSFSGVEGESYRVQVKFFSGGITGNGFTFLPYLELTGIAGKYDNFKTTSMNLQ